MKYSTIYITTQEDSLELLKRHFDRKNLDYKIVPTTAIGGETEEVAIDIAEKDRERARQVLHDTGFLKTQPTKNRRVIKAPEKKLVLLVVAGILFVLVIITVLWF